MRPIELERESPCGEPPARKRGADLLEERINTQRQKSLAPVGLVLVALVVALAAGCGSSKKATSTTTTVATASTGTGSTATAVDTKIAAEVPAAIKSKGTLIVAANPHYAPNEFIGTDAKTIVGMDPDLAKALAAVMGLKAKVVSASFSSIIPGVSSGKFNLGMSSITDTRQREKSVDFVTYFKAGTMFFTNATGGVVIQKGLADLCGHSVAVARGTTGQADATNQSAKCKSAGKSPITIFVYPNQTAVSLGVKKGRGQVGIADYPVAAYLVVKSNGQFKLTGTPYNVAPYGIAIPKGNGIAKPVLDALKVLMANGTYKAILTRWYVLADAITNPQINGAIS
jgi:polar amino acid transport system substrate-binding protein